MFNSLKFTERISVYRSFTDRYLLTLVRRGLERWGEVTLEFGEFGSAYSEIVTFKSGTTPTLTYSVMERDGPLGRVEHKVALLIPSRPS